MSKWRGKDLTFDPTEVSHSTLPHPTGSYHWGSLLLKHTSTQGGVGLGWVGCDVDVHYNIWKPRMAHLHAGWGGVGVGVIMFFASWHRDYMLRIAKL
jgi:hypothetical protein